MVLSLPRGVIEHQACGKKSGEESLQVLDGDPWPGSQRWAELWTVIFTQLYYFQLCRSVVNSPSHGVSPEQGVGPGLSGSISGFGVEEQDT